jgi:CHAD domain-containing protein
MRVMISLCEAAGPAGIGRKTRRVLRKPFQAAGELRDLQVAIRMLRRRAERYPASAALHCALQGRRARERERVREALGRKRARRLTGLVAELAGRLQEAAGQPASSARILGALAGTLQAMRRDFLAAPLSSAQGRELHELRIALKRLRYALELLAPLFDPVVGGGAAGLASGLQRLQAELGEITDLSMLVARVRAWRLKHPKRGRPLDALDRQLRREHDVRVRSMRAELGRLRQAGLALRPAAA